MGDGAPRLLVCDFEGQFGFCELLSKIGYLVDQVLPDALRHVSVGDHDLYVFAFKSDAVMTKTLKIVEKLKQAQLPTPILVASLAPPSPEFLNHQTSHFRADAYASSPGASELGILDAIEKMVGCPIPPSLRGRTQPRADEDKELRAEIERRQKKVLELEKELQTLRSQKEKSTAALEAERIALKPKLEALLQGQKLQHQSESERLTVLLSEVEAKLLDREAKVRQMEAELEDGRVRLEEITSNHEKALQALREFYQNKLKALSPDSSESKKA